MKLTQEEIIELNQMLDERINRLYFNLARFSENTRGMKENKVVQGFHKEALKEYDLLKTLKAKVNNDESKEL